jgi:hypothetical protein
VAALLATGLASPAAAADAALIQFDVGLAPEADPATVVGALTGAVVTMRPVHGLDAINIDVPAGQADAVLSLLRSAPGVTYAERSAVVQADSDQVFSGFTAMEIPQAWTWTTGSPDVTVAVVDTGVSANPDLAAARLTPGYDFVDDDSDATDDNGHGTLVANVLGADSNGIGGVGVCSACRIMPVRVLGDREGTTGNVAAGIAWATDHGAQVINLSLSAATDSRLLRQAVTYATERGSLVVASAGNERSTTHRFPAAVESVVAVGQYGTQSKNTATDRWVDLSAYGNFLVFNRTGQWAGISGSSGATAAASGVAALSFAMKPSATAGEVRAAMERDAEPNTNPSYPYQAPMINAAHTLYDLGGTDTVPPTVTATGLTENEFIAARGEPAAPQAADDHGVERIEVLVDGRPPIVVRRPGSQITVLPPAGHHGPLPVTVVAYDYAGNSGRTTTVVQVDSTVPTGTWVSPAANAVVHGTTIDVSLTTPDTDLATVASIYGDGSSTCGCALTRIAGTNRWQGRIALDPTGELRIALVDQAGNRRELVRTVLVDNAPPAGGTISPASGAKVRGTFTSKLTGVTDLGGVARAELWANGKYVGVDQAAPYQLAVKTGPSGKLTLIWKVTDRFGQARTLPARTLTADNTPPKVSITKAPKHKAKVKGTVKVYAQASDTNGIAKIQLLVNGKVMATGSVLTVNAGKWKKTMKVQVRAYDKVGNVKYTAGRTWYR